MSRRGGSGAQRGEESAFGCAYAALCRFAHTFLRYRPFRLSTLDPRLPQEGGEFQIPLARTLIALPFSMGGCDVASQLGAGAILTEQVSGARCRVSGARGQEAGLSPGS
jgi:hypothetical protein